MSEPISTLARLLSDVILPNLQAVQSSQAKQIGSNDRLEKAIHELRIHLDSQFATLTAQLTVCRAELAATQAILKAVQTRDSTSQSDRPTLIH